VPLVPGGTYELMSPQSFTLAYSASRPLNSTLSLVSLFFAALFILEAAIKLTAFGDQYFFDCTPQTGSQSFSMKLEFIVVVSCIFQIFMALLLWLFVDSNNIPYSKQFVADFFALLAALRPMRIFNILKASDYNYSRLIDVIRASVPYIVCTTLLMFVSIFIVGNFAIIWFGTIPESFSGTAGYPNEYANFRSLPATWMTCFGILTGQVWSELMRDINELSDDTNWYGYCGLFLCSWVMYCKYVLCNQFSAIVCDTFSETCQAETHKVPKPVYEDFSMKWSQWQVEHQGHGEAHNFMPLEHVPEFLTTLKLPLRVNKPAEITRLINEFLPISADGRVHVVELFDTVMKNVYERMEINLIPTATMRVVVAGVLTQFPEIQTNQLVKEVSPAGNIFRRARWEGTQVRRLNYFTATNDELAPPAKDTVVKPNTISMG